eukprot:1179048-Prorocentrum_minimum.AAC.2
MGTNHGGGEKIYEEQKCFRRHWGHARNADESYRLLLKCAQVCLSVQVCNYSPVSPITLFVPRRFSLPLRDWCPLRVYSFSPSVIGARYGYILSPPRGDGYLIPPPAVYRQGVTLRTCVTILRILRTRPDTGVRYRGHALVGDSDIKGICPPHTREVAHPDRLDEPEVHQRLHSVPGVHQRGRHLLARVARHWPVDQVQVQMAQP